MVLLQGLETLRQPPTRLSLSTALHSRRVRLHLSVPQKALRTTSALNHFKAFSLRLFPVRSPLLGESQLVSLPAAT